MPKLTATKKPVLAIHLRLIPTRTISDITPNPQMYISIYQLSQILAPNLSPYLFSVRIYLHQILFLCLADSPTSITQIWQFIDTIPTHLTKYNTHLKKQQNTFYFKYAVAADFQNTTIMSLPKSSISLEPYLLPDTLIERTDKIITHMPNCKYPIMITHALYEQLLPITQEQLDTCYYIMHICCYSKGAK